MIIRKKCLFAAKRGLYSMNIIRAFGHIILALCVVCSSLGAFIYIRLDEVMRASILESVYQMFTETNVLVSGLFLIVLVLFVYYYLWAMTAVLLSSVMNKKIRTAERQLRVSERKREKMSAELFKKEMSLAELKAENNERDEQQPNEQTLLEVLEKATKMARTMV